LIGLIHFVEQTHNTTPYFTDVCKCGVKQQRNKKGLSKRRIDHCISTFLLDEIRIIKPKIIYCNGRTAYNKIIKIKNGEYKSKNFELMKALNDPELNEILKKTDVLNLIHYSTQANLQLSLRDKKILWEIQTGKIRKKEFDDIIMAFDFVQELRKYLKN